MCIHTISCHWISCYDIDWTIRYSFLGGVKGCYDKFKWSKSCCDTRKEKERGDIQLML